MRAREAAVKTLSRILEDDAYSNLEISNTIKRSKVDERETRLYVLLVYGTLQHLLTIDYILKQFITRRFNQIDPKILWALRIAVFQIFFTERIPNYLIVGSAVDIAKEADPYMSSFVNGVLRNIIRHADEIREDLDYLGEVERYSVPKWIIEKYRESYGNKYLDILEKVNEVPPTTIRVRPELREGVFKTLKDLGAEPEELGNRVLAIRNLKALNKPLEKQKAYKQGIISIQDNGAVQIVDALNLREGDAVFDMCAAPGGKTIDIASRIGEEGIVLATDLHRHRLRLIEEQKERIGVDNIEVEQKDGLIHDKELDNMFDRVLVDAPCSGLGVIRRKPDIRYRVKEDQIEDLTKVQSGLLENAYWYAKPGGRIVYSTCTVGRAENEDVVRSVLNKHPDLRLIKEHHTGDENTEAFYYCVMKKL